MEDLAVEMRSENCDLSVSSCYLKDSTNSELIVETINSVDEDNVPNGTLESSSAQEPTLPILRKIINLSDSIQILKTEHSTLSNQVKDITTESFPGPDIVDTLLLISTEHEALKKKYLREFSERKKFYNEVIELKGNIRVFCRCRPLNQAETSDGTTTSVVEFESSQENEIHIISSDSSKKQFKFDHVFKPEDSQEAVFAQTKPVVASVLDGYNVCIFAYGQTGTGKTFTMEGTPENRGVNYKTLEELFRISGDRSGLMRYELFVSMLEVYNEKIRDLLVENSNQPSKKLEIKQTAEGTQEVPGLVEAQVYRTDEVWELLKSGSRVRSVGSTIANELSSRSHCLLRVTVKGENLMNGQRTRSHLWLVDLAGSERVGKIEVEGERLKESQFINKSLSALGDVIASLASKTGHVPYRNSKLTHLLQSSLGGDCKTLMFVQVSPSSGDLGETICSLNFATRVRGIECGPARKQGDVAEMFKYKQMAEKLKHDEKETKKLQDSLQSSQVRLAAREHLCRTLQDKIRDLENQLAEERKIRIKQENRAFATTTSSSTPSSGFSRHILPEKTTNIERKPPLGPSKMRLPLRRISNMLPQPSPVRVGKFSAAKSTTVARDGIENIRRSYMTSKNTTNISNLLKPRRGSFVVRPPPPSSTTGKNNSLQPRRRVSIATLRPEPNTQTTPRYTSGGMFARRPSFVQDPRKARYSRLFSPLPELETASSEVAATPMAAMRSSSKFMGSPPKQAAGSWRPSHPTVVALQRKPLVWSPLKLRSMQNSNNFRKSSILPRRNVGEMP